MESYFIDTSVWIRFFRAEKTALSDFLERLLRLNRVFTDGVVLAELLVGARTEKERDQLAFFWDGLNFLEMSRVLFVEAGCHGFSLKRKGISVPFNDLIIATHCLHEDLVLIDDDKHFSVIAEHLPLKRHL
jgi:predicted nucleic acid-binding protein